MNVLGLSFIALGASAMAFVGAAPGAEGTVALAGAALLLASLGVCTLVSEWRARRQQQRILREVSHTIPLPGSEDSPWPGLLASAPQDAGDEDQAPIRLPSWNQMKAGWRQGAPVRPGRRPHPLRLKLSGAVQTAPPDHFPKDEEIPHSLSA